MNAHPIVAGAITDDTTAKANAHAWNDDPANAAVPFFAMAGPHPFGKWDTPDWTVWLIAKPKN